MPDLQSGERKGCQSLNKDPQRHFQAGYDQVVLHISEQPSFGNGIDKIVPGHLCRHTEQACTAVKIRFAFDRSCHQRKHRYHPDKRQDDQDNIQYCFFCDLLCFSFHDNPSPLIFFCCKGYIRNDNYHHHKYHNTGNCCSVSHIVILEYL